MLYRRVNGYKMAYIEVGQGDPPLVCVHGTVGDFRVWSPVLGPLSQQRRVLLGVSPIRGADGARLARHRNLVPP
jgi:pimeloyl-ACP methyl ester carboxylesterase